MNIAGEFDRTNGLVQFFSFDGRVRRMTFWINALVVVVIRVALNLMLVDTFVSPYTLEVTTEISAKPVYYALSLIITIRWLAVVARRWHDQNRSGWLALIVLAPMLGLFFPGLAAQMVFSLVAGLASLVAIGFLGFVPGDEDANDYGAAPEEGQLF